jgi:hypothetical protein
MVESVRFNAKEIRGVQNAMKRCVAEEGGNANYSGRRLEENLNA